MSYSNYLHSVISRFSLKQVVKNEEARESIASERMALL
jgi:hypothetical protein